MEWKQRNQMEKANCATWKSQSIHCNYPEDAIHVVAFACHFATFSYHELDNSSHSLITLEDVGKTV